MLRRRTILTTAALMAVCAAPASGQTYQDLRSPDAQDAARTSAAVSVTSSDPDVLGRDYGSPDAVDAARDLEPVQASTVVTRTAEPASGFDWGDAAIGAAAMFALFSIAAGAALLLSGRRRGPGVRVATH